MQEKMPAATPVAPAGWRCLNCDYAHDGPEAPEVCPVCAAPSERFEPLSQRPEVQIQFGERRRVVVIGAGIAGVSAAQSARETSPEAEVFLVSKETEIPYYRLNLTRYLAGEIDAASLPIHPEEWYESQGVQFLRGAELHSLDLENKKASFHGADFLYYDSLVLAIGSHPFVPPIPGTNKENLTVLRTKTDADFILDQSRSGCRCVVVGGGLLGLETAGALSKQGADVTLLEGHRWLMPRQLNEKGGKLLEKFLEPMGIRLIKRARVQEIAGDERVRGVVLMDGETVPADLVVVATGVRPNSYIARMKGAEVNQGIVVNNTMMTSLPDVFAAGDVAEHRGVCYGTWAPSQYQGIIAGINAAGGRAEFAGIPRSNMLKVLGYDLFSMGPVAAEDASYRAVEGKLEKNYYQFLFRDNHLKGFILLGDTRLSAEAKRVVEKGLDCAGLLAGSPGIREVLDFLENSGA
jgi:nitrite reductase (NADH) large subunit